MEILWVESQDVQNTLPRQIWRRSVEPLLRNGEGDRRPPSCICDECVWTTHEGHLVVVIAVQNLVGIDAYSRPQNGFLGGFDPLNGVGYLIATHKRH